MRRWPWYRRGPPATQRPNPDSAGLFRPIPGIPLLNLSLTSGVAIGVAVPRRGSALADGHHDGAVLADAGLPCFVEVALERRGICGIVGDLRELLRTGGTQGVERHILEDQHLRVVDREVAQTF